MDAATLASSAGGDWLLTSTQNGTFENKCFGNMQSVFFHNGADLIVKFSGDDHGIYVNGEQIYRFSTPGVICAVLDTTANTCVDVVTFAAQTNFELSR